MFSGLSKYLKKILPKRLFYRALLIVAVPVIVIQLIITIVFFDSLWIKTNKGMTKALVSEINTFLEVYNDEIYNKDEITKIFSVYQDLNIEYVDNNDFNYNFEERLDTNHAMVNRRPLQEVPRALAGLVRWRYQKRGTEAHILAVVG